MTETVTSADGTAIAYDRQGDGPALIIVGGALNTRQSPGELLGLLASRFTVIAYDRRGRGDSGDTQPYAIEREVEDLAALIEAAGGSAFVYGHSSGAILALEAASRGFPLSRVAAYEPPYTFDPDNPQPASDGGVQAALDAGDRALAVTNFMRLTGMPQQAIDGVTQAPFWPGMLAIAHTLPYDLALSGDGAVPAHRLEAIAVPTLVMHGGASPAWAARSAAAIVQAVPDARQLAVAGQDHGVDPAVLAPLLIEFFA